MWHHLLSVRDFCKSYSRRIMAVANIIMVRVDLTWSPSRPGMPPLWIAVVNCIVSTRVKSPKRRRPARLFTEGDAPLRTQKAANVFVLKGFAGGRSTAKSSHLYRPRRTKSETIRMKPDTLLAGYIAFGRTLSAR